MTNPNPVVDKATDLKQHQDSIKQALALYEANNATESLKLFKALIKQYKQELAAKPQSNLIRNALKDIWQAYSDSVFFGASIRFPDEIQQAKDKEKSNKLSVKSLIFDVFLENEWKKQYLGKFGGPKPKSYSWKNYYLHCESKIDEDSAIENRVKWSVENGHINYFVYLANNFEFNVNNLFFSNGQSLISRSISRGHDALSLYLLDHFPKNFEKDSDGWTPLHYASYSGSTHIVSRLIEEKHPINIKDTGGVMPIHVACFQCFFDVLKLLLFSGSKTNVHSKNGLMPLHISFHKLDLQSTELLIEHGADINQKDPFGRTLLHWTAAKNHEAFMMLLIENNVSINAKDKLGRTALHYAAQLGNSSAIHVLITHKCHLNTLDTFQVSPLITAAFFENSPEASILFENGAR